MNEIQYMNEIEQLFYERYEGYTPSLEGLDKQLNDSDKRAYYIRIKDLIGNTALQAELDEWKRKLYKELALKANNDLERQGYRMTLIAIQDFETRLRRLASLARENMNLTKPADML
ncbi:MAG: hypothetical protein ABII13_05660 [Patescibacteria group bacterium]